MPLDGWIDWQPSVALPTTQRTLLNWHSMWGLAWFLALASESTTHDGAVWGEWFCGKVSLKWLRCSLPFLLQKGTTVENSLHIHRQLVAFVICVYVLGEGFSSVGHFERVCLRCFFGFFPQLWAEVAVLHFRCEESVWSVFGKRLETRQLFAVVLVAGLRFL